RGEAVNEGSADDRVAADADAGGLAEAVRRELVDDLVGQRAASRYQTNLPGRADVPGNDPHLAAARRDEAGAVGADEPRAALLEERDHLRHVEDGNALRDAHDERNAALRRFEDRRGRH